MVFAVSEMESDTTSAVFFSFKDVWSTVRATLSTVPVTSPTVTAIFSTSGFTTSTISVASVVRRDALDEIMVTLSVIVGSFCMVSSMTASWVSNFVLTTFKMPATFFRVIIKKTSAPIPAR